MHQIGVGVLGPVYRAQDTVRDQLVAVKVFKVDAPPEQAEQIAEALQAVVQALPRHRGLVEFIAAGVERDTAYLVMAHSDVPSLDSRLKPGASVDSSSPPVDAEQALVIVRTLAEAMDAAHARGIVHGGLHPRDIFVDDRGACRAAGFGVATALERAGVKVPVRRPYSPPERLTSAPIEPPSDRFALGAIAFELLTGRRINGTGSNAAARYNASVPGADLDAVRNALAAMLAEQPGHRPSTASAFATALSMALFPQGVARASAAGAATATGATRAPRAGDANPTTGSGSTGDVAVGAGLTAGAIAAGASNRSRGGDNDGPSSDDLELFTREGLLTGQPRQSALSWEPVEVENVLPPGKDPLELFAPSAPSEPSGAPDAVATSDAAPGEPAVPPAMDASVDAKAGVNADAPEVVITRPDSILGLSTTIVALREPDGSTPEQPADVSSDDDGHETTALPFVPIKADPRLSPVSAASTLSTSSASRSSRLHDSVLIDDNSRIDALDHASDHAGHGDHLEHLDRLDHGVRLDPGGQLDHLEHLDDLDRFERGDDVHEAAGDEADDESYLTPAAAAAAGVVAAGGVTADPPELSAAHSANHSYASQAAPSSHSSHAQASSVPDDEPVSDTSHFPPARERAQSSWDRDREAREAETWVAPTAAPVARPSSMLTNPPETSDVGSSVRVVGLVLALGLAVGGAGGYLLGQRGALRTGSPLEQAAPSGEAGAARPAAGGDQAGAAGAAGTDVPISGGSAAATAGKAGDGAARDARNPAAGANASAARPGSGPNSGAANTPGTASSAAGTAAGTGASAARPAAAPAATGRLIVTSSPARADVAIDGVRRGVTPLTLRDLTAGSHTVRVTRGGYAPETRRVNIVAGRPAESISIDLEPTGPRSRPSTPGPNAAAGAAAPAHERGSASGLGSLYVVSRPMGARVTVDGRVVGVTPLLLTDVSSGSHTIELTADGHKPWQTTVQVKLGERTRVAASLEEGR